MLYILFNYLVSITFIAPAFFNIPSEEQGRAYTFEVSYYYDYHYYHVSVSVLESVFQKIPNIPNDIPFRPGFFALSTDNQVYSICIISLIFVVCPQIILFVLLIFRYLTQTRSQSPATLRLQLLFFIAMCFQLSIPFLVIFLPAAYIVFAIQYDYYNQGMNN